jgi:hypothetical protein
MPLQPQTGSHCSVQKVVVTISEESKQLAECIILEQSLSLEQLNVMNKRIIIKPKGFMKNKNSYKINQ